MQTKYLICLENGTKNVIFSKPGFVQNLNAWCKVSEFRFCSNDYLYVRLFWSAISRKTSVSKIFTNDKRTLYFY